MIKYMHNISINQSNNSKPMKSKNEKKQKRNTLKNIQGLFFRTQTILIVTLALFLGVAGTVINIRYEAEKRDRNLQNIAEAIARSPIISSEITDSATSLVLCEYLDSLKETLDDIDVISVVGLDRMRVYHSNHELIGTLYDGTSPEFGNDVWFYAADETGPSGTQRRAYAAVYDADGGYVGFVMAIMLKGNIYNKTYQTVFTFAAITAIAIALELAVSAELFGKIKKSLLGYEPDVFTAMYKIRDNILESLDEGIVAVDRDGTVQFANKAAFDMLSVSGEAGDVIGSKIDSINGGAVLSRTLEGGEKEFNARVGSSNVLIDSIAVKEDGKTVGAVGILHNREEYTKLMEDLAGTRYLVDSMRANNHDFTNKLHVILGLIQMEMYDEASSYIQSITVVQRESISKIMNAVGEPALAALLIGKTARAAELNVKFVLEEGSHYSVSDIRLPSEVLVTVAGNLIDNALESMNGSADYGAEKRLVFGIHSSGGTLLITVDDTGGGISERDLPHIFENGYSTKDEGRGTGLYQVKTMVEGIGGKIGVESQVGVKTSFSVTFSTKPGEVK